MKILRRLLLAVAVLAIVAYAGMKIFVGAVNVPLAAKPVDAAHLALQAPPGFTVSVLASNLSGPRVLRFTRHGGLVVSLPGRDQVVMLRKVEHGTYDGITVLLDKKALADKHIDNFKDPNGIDFYRDANGQDWLYVAENEAVGRIAFDHNRGETVGDYTRIITGLPGGGNHWKKALRFGPDGKLYLAIGSSCNACIESDARRATILRFDPDGTHGETYASGLRNSEGFDWNDSGELYATDNGRDLIGDDFPPCEFNKIEQGKFYGWPFANGDRVPDPDHGKGHEQEIAASVAPAHGFRAHNAPLGMTFVHHAQVPDDYRGAAIVALHGSWNRSHKDGYKVVSLRWQPDGAIVEQDFLTGFLSGDTVSGRPVDVTVGPDDALYISDDFAGAIYRVAYTAEKKT